MTISSCTCCEDTSDCPTHEWTTIARRTTPCVFDNNLHYATDEPFKISDGPTEIGPFSNNTTVAELAAELSSLLPGTCSDSEGDNEKPLKKSTVLIVLQPAATIELSLGAAYWELSTEDNISYTLKRRPGVWEALKLDNYPNAVWQWRVRLIGTGDIPPETHLYLGQAQREYKEWTAPITDRPDVQSFSLSVEELQWDDSTLRNNVVGGSFRVVATANGLTAQTAPIAWNCTAEDLALAVQALPIAQTLGTVVVSGGPFPTTAIAVECTGALARVSLGVLSGLVGLPPAVLTTTLNDGSAPVGLPAVPEHQMLDYQYPTHSGEFRISLKNPSNKTKTTRWLPYNCTAAQVQQALEDLSNVPTGVVQVTETGQPHQVADHKRFFVRFLGVWNGLDIEELSVESELRSNPPVSVVETSPSVVDEFRQEWDPLNVGTLYKHYVRNAFGNIPSREVRRVLIQHTTNRGQYPYQVIQEDQPIGYGVFNWTGCDGTSDQVGVYRAASVVERLTATLNKDTGEIVVDSTLPYEVSLEIRCLACHHAQEFSQWGFRESVDLDELLIYDTLEPTHAPDPDHPTFVCGVQGRCRDWSIRGSNIPYTSRTRFGPDGYDGHLLHDKFVREGEPCAEAPPCQPDVVLLGDGHYLEQNFSTMFNQWKCLNGQPTQVCEIPWKLESQIEHPTSNIDRLKLIYGEQFSYWGGWIHPDSFSGEKITCRFEDYDLSNIKVLFLGGLTVAGCSQVVSTFGKVISQSDRDKYLEWLKVVDKEFEETALEPLKRWLDLGERVLVLDGGHFPTKFYTALGLQSTIEPFSDFTTPQQGNLLTLNGSLLSTPCWGPELPTWNPRTQTAFEPIYCDPEIHPFTEGVLKSYDDNGEYLLDEDYTYDGTNIAGHPVGNPRATRGLLTVSQKFAHDTRRYPGVLIPTSGLRSYTTAIPRITPSSDAIVIGRVKGELPIYPWKYMGQYTTAPIDYPGIVVEPWRTVTDKLPSRVVLSAVNELVEADAWGVNWANFQLTAEEAVQGFHITQSGDNTVGTIGMRITIGEDGSTFSRCEIVNDPFYGLDGYGWGRGLSSVASRKFLENLLTRRKEF